MCKEMLEGVSIESLHDALEDIDHNLPIPGTLFSEKQSPLGTHATVSYKSDGVADEGIVCSESATRRPSDSALLDQMRCKLSRASCKVN